jgi:hypothetical protein
MFSIVPNGKITVAQILLPTTLVAFALFLMLSFQMTQVLRDRDALHQAKAQQEKPLEDAQKVQTQLDALVKGTQNLAEKGDKKAKGIVDKLIKLGVLPNPNAATAAPGATPAAAPSATSRVAPPATKAAKSHTIAPPADE